MRTMKFRRLYLLSRDSRRAFTMEFGPGATVIQAPNGYGKSALLKSLYDAFGAEPHRVDDRWKSERVVTAVEFAIDGIVRTIVKSGGMYAIFDEAGAWQFQTSSGINANPITWTAKGKQYVTVLSGYGGLGKRWVGEAGKNVPQGGSVWTFALSE